MCWMFDGCSELKSLDVSGVNTGKVTDADQMVWFSRIDSRHIVKMPSYVPYNCMSICEDYVIYKLDDNGAIHRSVEYEECIVGSEKPIICIREINHRCDEDDNVSITDAVVLKKYLAGYDGLDISMGAADVDVDLSIKINDAVKLMKYLAGTNEQP